MINSNSSVSPRIFVNTGRVCVVHVVTVSLEYFPGEFHGFDHIWISVYWNMSYLLFYGSDPGAVGILMIVVL